MTNGTPEPRDTRTPGELCLDHPALADPQAFERHGRALLADAPPVRVFHAGTHPLRGDHDLNPGVERDVRDLNPRAAAVLVPIVAHADELTVLLTLRAADLPSHAGQVAFPGGKVEGSDGGPRATALREAHEEIGLTGEAVTTLGYLDSYQTGTGFRIVPVVALVEPGFTLDLDSSEVSDAFEVPLSFLMHTANHQLHSVELRGGVRQYYAMPYRDRYIWGATAGILRNMQETLFTT